MGRFIGSALPTWLPTGRKDRHLPIPDYPQRTIVDIIGDIIPKQNDSAIPLQPGDPRRYLHHSLITVTDWLFQLLLLGPRCRPLLVCYSPSWAATLLTLLLDVPQLTLPGYCCATLTPQTLPSTLFPIWWVGPIIGPNPTVILRHLIITTLVHYAWPDVNWHTVSDWLPHPGQNLHAHYTRFIIWQTIILLRTLNGFIVVMTVSYFTITFPIPHWYCWGPGPVVILVPVEGLCHLRYWPDWLPVLLLLPIPILIITTWPSPIWFEPLLTGPIYCSETLFTCLYFAWLVNLTHTPDDFPFPQFGMLLRTRCCYCWDLVVDRTFPTIIVTPPHCCDDIIGWWWRKLMDQHCWWFLADILDGW